MKIKYDKTEQKIFLIAALICTPGLPLGLLFLFTEWGAVVPVLYLILMYFSPIVAIAAWFGYLDSRFYFGELEKHGIDLPVHKKNPAEYDRFVMQINEAQKNFTNAPKVEPFEKSSMILAGIAWVIAAGHLLWLFWYAGHFAKLGMGGEIGFMIFVGLLVTAGWGGGGYFYFRQRSNTLYKNDGDPYPGKKIRANLAKGILTMLVMLCITSAGFRLIYSMTDYVYRSRLQNIYGDDWRDHLGDRVEKSYLKDDN